MNPGVRNVNPLTAAGKSSLSTRLPAQELSTAMDCRAGKAAVLLAHSWQRRSHVTMTLILSTQSAQYSS